MTPFAALLGFCALTALAALVLSGTRQQQTAARLARASLWGALAGPLAIVLTLLMESYTPGTHWGAFQLGRAISMLMSYGAALIPTALVASVALRRAHAIRRTPPRS